MASEKSVKSPDALRTISEVSEILEIPKHVLRFWETKFSALRPVQRTGGRRYYRASDVALLIRIKTLLYQEGYTIQGAARRLRAHPALVGTVGTVSLSASVRDELSECRTLLQHLRQTLRAVS